MSFIIPEKPLNRALVENQAEQAQNPTDDCDNEHALTVDATEQRDPEALGITGPAEERLIAVRARHRHRGIISAVDPDSPADRVGLLPGDALCAINGHDMRDLIDVKYYGTEARCIVEIERDDKPLTFVIFKEEGEPLGIDFEEATFDGIYRCNNRCNFCFVDQMPRQMRKTLYVKDDDYRYSFLFASFVTMSNLLESDWQRINEQRLSPLYVSVHTTDPELRRFMLGNTTAPDPMAQLRRLAIMRIQAHTQVVLCPGINDGEALERTVRDLSSLYPHVRSISIVPAGLTAHRKVAANFRRTTPEDALRVIEQAKPWQQEWKQKHGFIMPVLSDEFYLLAGQPVPPASYYSDFEQYENGVGMTRVLLDEWARARRRPFHVSQKAPLKANGQRRRVYLACAELIAPTLQRVVDWLNSPDIADQANLDFELIAVRNRFFGSVVNVSGLLTAKDFDIELKHRREAGLGPDQDDLLIIPRVMLDDNEGRTLDDVWLRDMPERWGCHVRAAATVPHVLGHVKRFIPELAG